MKYAVRLEQTRAKTVFVEAETRHEAEETALDLYFSEDVVFTDADVRDADAECIGTAEEYGE